MNREQEIIEKLNSIRLSKGISVYRLSELTGINQSTLANTFSRRTVPSVVNLEIMCNAMGVSLSQFFTKGETSELLTIDEKKMINNYRRLSDELKKSIVDLLEKIIQSERE